MKNVISKQYVCIVDIEGKTVKRFVFSHNEEEALFLFTDGTFARLKAQGYEDGEAALETVSHILNSDLLLNAYSIEVLREFVPEHVLNEWLEVKAKLEQERKDRDEQYERDLYERLKAKFGNL